MHRISFIPIILLYAMTTYAIPSDSLPQHIEEEVPRAKHGNIMGKLVKFVKNFSDIDTTYVEPQHYNFTFMMQNTNTFEFYTLRDQNGHEISFSPRPSYKVGPYFGWRWIFLGYTFDLRHFKGNEGRQDINLSLYSSQVGVDLFYRKSGKSYRIRRLITDREGNFEEMHNTPFAGIQSSIKGFNLYYIFNHRKFSYPAAYSQSTVQKRSCGSPIIGIGYTRHELSIDWNGFSDMVRLHTGNELNIRMNSPQMEFSNIRYTDYSVSGGYAYNWVFARQWLFDISLQAALAYKHSTGDSHMSDKAYKQNFNFSNFNVDGILRTGVVWNNNKWYIGANSIFHAYRYRKKNFSTNNIFGNVNVYVGVNFGKRKQ